MARMLVVVALMAAAATTGAAVFAHGSEAAPAAQIQRTFVSTSGNDANPCTRTDPCRGFPAAIANTLAGGEVIALDSGGYGVFTVDKSLTVAGAPGAHVAITAFAGNGITVDAGAADAVVLRNLYVTGLGGFNGIGFLGGASLSVDSVTVTGFAGSGLEATATDGELFVRDSTFRASGGQAGVLVNGALRAEILDSRAERNTQSGFKLIGARGNITGCSASQNGSGYFFQTGAVATVTRSVADGNSNGVLLFNAGTDVTLSAVVLTNNVNHGLAVASPSVARIGGSTVSGNGDGLNTAGATLETFGDNLVRGNTTNVSGTITAVGKT
jgi:parallel beta helix pectate lyase-like protein